MKWLLLLAVGLAACGGPRQPNDALDSALKAHGTDWHAAPGLQLTADGTAYATVADPEATANVRLQLKGEVTVEAVTGGQTVTFRPLSVPEELNSWGPGRPAGSSLVSVTKDGAAALVERAQPNGVKEDIVLTRRLNDALRFSWKLELSAGLEARLDPNGSVGVYGVSGVLAGPIAVSDEKTAAAIALARTRAKHDVLRFRIPAPTVTAGDGKHADEAARFELTGSELRLVVEGLDRLRYPVSIDPSVLVTNASDFELGGNRESNLDVTATSIKRTKLIGGVGAWAATTALPATRFAHASVAYNGFLYVLGGTSGGADRNDVIVAPINPSGTLGAFSTTSAFTTARSGLAAVAYNGNLYVVGGFNQASNTALNDVQVAPINLNGTLGAFRATTSFTTGRSAHAAAAYNGYLYVLGGQSASSTYFNDVQVAPLGGTGDLGAFAFTTSFTGVRSGHTAAAYNGFMYLAGGTNGAALGDVQLSALNPNGTLAPWTNTSTLMKPRALHGMAIAGGYLYVTGNGAEVQLAPISRGGSVGPFGLNTPFTTARDSHATVAYNGNLYVIGGQSGGTPFGDIQVAPLAFQTSMSRPLATNTFGTGMMFQRYAHCAAAGSGYLYITGGSVSGTFLQDVLYAPIAADGTIGAFSPDTTLIPTTRAEHGCFTYQGYLFVVGGRNSGGYLSDVQVAPITGTGHLGAFAATSTMPGARGSAGVALFVLTQGTSAYAFVAGGYDGTTRRSEVFTATVNATGSLGAWSTSAVTLPTGRSGQSAVAYNNFLYVTGGVDATGWLTDVQAAPISGGTLSAFSLTSPFAVGRGGHNTVAYNSALYIIGGNGMPGDRNDVQAAPVLNDGGLAAFTQVGTLPVAEYVPSSVVNDGFLYITGGLNQGAFYSNTVYTSTLFNAGTVGAPVDTAATVAAAPYLYGDMVVNNGFLYLVGGYVGGVGQSSVRYATLSANGSLGALQATTSLPSARFAHATVVYNNFLYVVGGFAGTQLNDIQYAPINANGTLGAFTATTTLPIARSDHTAVAYNGRLYVIGGKLINTPTGDIVWAPINPDGTLGAFTTAASVISPARSDHGTALSNGNLYVLGGYTGAVSLSDVLMIPIQASGAPGTATQVGSLPYPSQPGHSAGAADGYLFFAGGGTARILSAPISSTGSVGNFAVQQWLAETYPGGATATVGNGYVYVLGGFTKTAIDVATIRTPAARATYSKLIDLQNQSNTLSLVSNSTASGGTTSVEYRVAPVSGVFPATSTSLGAVTSGASIPLVGANVRYAWLRYTLEDVATASGVTLAEANERDVTDFTLTSTAIPLAIAPTMMTVAPRQGIAFTASGGSGTGLTWAMAMSGSGGTVVNGAYTAGATGSKTDIVQVTDSLNNMATATVTVSAGVSAMPAAPSVAPRGAVSFTASGGSGSGFTWSPVTILSGGMITAGGAYTAGTTGSVVDQVKVTDSLGNTATVSITVTAGVTIAPQAPSVVPSGTVNFTAMGGSNTGFTWTLTQNQSTGASVGGATGQYHAGTMQGTDIVKVTDSLGNSATVNITVTNSLAVTPNPVSIPPRGSQQFMASGGSGTGFTFAFVTNNSGGTLSPAGAYTAGATPSVQDTLKATDSLNNTAMAIINVGAGLTPKATPAMVPPKGPSALSAMGGSGAGLTWAFVTNASDGGISGSSYTAGSIGSVMDVVRVTDSLGNSGTTSIDVGPVITIAPATVTVTPLGSQQLTASGGSGVGYTWSLLTNNSMGNVGPSSGIYVAGRVGSVVDTVQVIDSLGNVATRDVTVTAAVTVSPAAPVVPPLGSKLLMAMGGTGTGYTWLFVTNRSGGNILANSGAYTAGGTANVMDDIQVIDSIGNIGTVSITVGAPLMISPAMPTVTPKQMLTFTATGGAGANRWALMTNASGGSIDTMTGAYTAGVTGGVIDTVAVMDSLGNVATTPVTVSTALQLSPPTASVPPQGSKQFTAMGGSDAGYTFSVSTNRSGGSIDATGAYKAGTTPNVSDVVTVSDGLASATATVSVGDGVSISPATANLDTGATQTFTATGGSGVGYQWSVSTNASGGSIDATSGVYTAGSAGNTTDDITVTDSLGNTATAHVTVVGGTGVTNVPAGQRNPVEGFGCGCHADGGGAASLLLGLLALRRRRRGAVASPVRGLLARRGLVIAATVLLAATASAAGTTKKSKPAAAQPAPAVVPAPEPTPAIVAPPPPVAATPPPPPAPPPAPGKPSMAVLDVEITVGEPKLDVSAFTDIVVNAVEATESFKVISSSDMKTMLGVERQRQLMGCAEESSCAVELANALGSQFVFSGNVGRVGDTFVVTSKVIDAPHNRVVGRASVQTKSPNALLESMWRTATEALDVYGASLPAQQAAAWAARPKPTPPATVTVSEPSLSMFGAVATAMIAYQPLSVGGKRGSVGGEVDFSWRRKRIEVLAGVVIAQSPGARLTGLFAPIDSRFRLDVGVEVALFPGLGPLFGGGPTLGAEFAITPHWFVQARGTFEAFPTGGTVILSMLGGVGVAARF